MFSASSLSSIQREEMCLQRQTARERGGKIWLAHEAVADGLTLHQYITEAAGVFNPYAVKRGSAEYNNEQQRWREQARIDYGSVQS